MVFLLVSVSGLYNLLLHLWYKDSHCPLMHDLVYLMLMQVLPLIKERLQISIFKNSLKIIQSWDSSLGDGFSPLGSTTCSHLPSSWECWLSWPHHSWPVLTQHKFPWLRLQEGPLLFFSANSCPPQLGMG